MKKNRKELWLAILIAGLLLSGINAYADGDVIVDGQLQVAGAVSVYLLPAGCGGGGLTLTTSSTCYTLWCKTVDEVYYYYTCAGSCGWDDEPNQCNATYVGKVFP